MRELKFFLLTGVLIQNFNIVDLVKFLEKNQKLHIWIVTFTYNVTSCKTKILRAKQTSFLAPCPLALGQFQPHGCMQKLLRKHKKNELNTHFQQNFITCSYRVGIGRAWCSQKACEICSSLIQTKKD
jgi:hypothetical protein